MLHRPDLLLLDEPTAGVDPTARRDFWEELHRLAAQGISVLVSTHYMDEAERCHKLAYIAYGRLIAQGTARQIVDSQQLHTLSITGNNLQNVSSLLEGKPGIEQTVMFGEALHVSGRDEELLRHSITEVAGTRLVTEAETSLEDVFIYLMKCSRDNYEITP